MARIRTIKSDFFFHEELAKLPAQTRLFFIGLWPIADKEGRLEDRPVRIKAQVFPWEDCDIEEMLRQLALGGFIVRYEAVGKRYISIPGFVRHQRPHPKEAPSELPAPSCVDGELSREAAALIKSREISGSIPSGPPGVGREGVFDNGSGNESPNQVSLSEQASAVFTYWQERLKKPKAKFDSNRRSKVEARLREKRTVEELKQAIDGCALSPWHQGDNPDGKLFDDIELICRDAKHVEGFIATAQSPPRPKPKGKTLGRIEPDQVDWNNVKEGITEGFG